MASPKFLSSNFSILWQHPKHSAKYIILYLKSSLYESSFLSEKSFQNV